MVNSQLIQLACVIHSDAMRSFSRVEATPFVSFKDDTKGVAFNTIVYYSHMPISGLGFEYLVGVRRANTSCAFL